METFTFPQFSRERSTVHAALFTNVSNAGALRKRIIDAAGMEGEAGERERDAVNFAFIDARLITSRLHLQTAIYHAILAESQNSLRTRTVHSEVLWMLNPTNNITEALRRYGVSDKTASVIVVSMDGATSDKMAAAVTGALSPFGALDTVTDWAAVKKYHKLNGEAGIEKGGRTAVDRVVVSIVAMKNVMS
ncbi:putative CGI121 TPRKB family protein [Lyophyllum shimeji]|uniref:EKC/KEOPS complex subunit CGI121 n=1 Tax=Lyophyllum shimeji TaxID=47721 RepID=A0A9P3PCS2_LYOSH|nr:putative CGI121 TPRKB family protein [Lyophyllum shimeji]